jgi:spermidine/putrescine transport system permease protein
MNRKLAPLVLAGAAALAAAAAPLHAAKELNLFAWSEYVPQAVLDKFTEETGITVNYETYASNEEMLSKLTGGAEYDLIQPSEYVIETLGNRGMLVPLDRGKIPNMKNIDRQYLSLPHDPQQKFSVPYMVGTVGIVVNTEKIKEPIKGYKDVFSGKYAGRIVTLDDNRELLTWSLAAAGQNINKIDDAAIAKARPLLAEWLPQIKVFDSDSPKTAFLNGEVDIGIVWSGEAALLHNEDPKYVYVLPAEGAHMFIDSLCIPKGAPHADSAHKFLDFILRPEISKMISEEFPYTNPNDEARKLLSNEELANPASYPKNPGKLETFRDIGKSASLVDQLITDLRGGA